MLSKDFYSYKQCVLLSVLIFHHKIISRVQYIALEVITFLKGKYFFSSTDIKLIHNSMEYVALPHFWNQNYAQKMPQP